MPLYEYECESCGRRFERIQKFSDPPIAECPHCAGPVRKLMSSPAIQFKGSGFYITDYARSGKGGEGESTGKSGSADKSSSKTTGGEKTESTSTAASPSPSPTETSSGDSKPAPVKPTKGGSD